MAGHAADLENALREATQRCLEHAADFFVPESSCLPATRFSSLLETYCNEAAIGLDLIASDIETFTRTTGRPPRILEVGAGIGLLSGAIRLAGHDVVGVEPAAGEFSMMAELSACVQEALLRPYPDYTTPVVRKAILELDPVQDGRFDIIFSVHVLEHLHDLPGAFDAMDRLLAPGGHMIHLCPNYTMPYEPHLAIPLVPGAPRASAWFFRRAVARQKDVWDSLNFLTAGRMKRLSRARSREITFDSGVMGRFLRRLETDASFRNRHQGLATRLYGALKRLGVLQLIDRLPAGLASPMIMRIR